MSIPERGALFLVDFPFAERDRTKRRPACVLSANRFNAGPDVLLAMVTSSRRRLEDPGPGDAPLSAWDEAGLRAPSVVRTGRLLVVLRNQLDARLGHLREPDQHIVDHELRQVLGLT